MERDGLRCMVIPTYDEDISLPKYASLRPPSDLPFDIVQLEIAHVVPQAFFQQVDLNSINITVSSWGHISQPVADDTSACAGKCISRSSPDIRVGGQRYKSPRDQRCSSSVKSVDTYPQHAH
jgi:hypothetical protein